MEIIKIVAVVAALAAAVWGLYMLMKISDKARKDRSNEAPYKIERPMSAEQLAVPGKLKRKYTKRSKYWSSPKVKTKMSKARKARKSSKSK